MNQRLADVVNDSVEWNRLFERLHGEERSTVPRARLVRRTGRILSGSPSVPAASVPPFAPPPFLPPSRQLLYFSQTGWPAAAIFGSVYVSFSPRCIAMPASLLLVTSHLLAIGASLCFGARGSDPWKCRNLVASLDSVPSASPPPDPRIGDPKRRCSAPKVNNEAGKRAWFEWATILWRIRHSPGCQEFRLNAPGFGFTRI